MRKRGAAVVLQRAQHWVGINLIARATQDTASIIAGKVIPKGCDRATIVENRSAERAGIQDSIPDRRLSCVEQKTAAIACRVAADGAVHHRQRSATFAGDAAATAGGRVVANRTVSHR
jgi:hypothetical protein